MEAVTDFTFLGFKITALKKKKKSLQMVSAAMTLAPWKKSYDKPR